MEHCKKDLKLYLFLTDITNYSFFYFKQNLSLHNKCKMKQKKLDKGFIYLPPPTPFWTNRIILATVYVHLYF